MTEKIRKAWQWITVPLEIEVDVTPIGKSWFDKKPWIEVYGVWQPKEKAWTKYILLVNIFYIVMSAINQKLKGVYHQVPH